MAATIRVFTPGKAKPQPFTICIFANPLLEMPFASGVFRVDPVIGMQAAFDASAQYISDSIRGLIAGQAEHLFTDPTMAADLRVVSIFEPGLAIASPNSLVAEDNLSPDLLVARRDNFGAFATRHGEFIDVGIAVSASAGHKRATTWPATDDEAGAGVPFKLDGMNKSHRLRTAIPGTTAIHVTERSLTPLHEFQHAMGSFTNGQIVDLYFDSSPDVNCKQGRPVPPSFGTYQSTVHRSDLTRNGLGYPSGWSSFHCGLIDTTHPAVMDNYNVAGAGLNCQNDTITRQFLIDRIRARMSR